MLLTVVIFTTSVSSHPRDEPELHPVEARGRHRTGRPLMPGRWASVKEFKG